MVYRRGMDPILLIYGTRRYRSAGDPSIATGRITVTTASLSPDTAMQASLYEDGGGLQGMRSLAVERGIASASVPAGRYTLEVSITGENVQGVENPAVGRSMPTHTATFTTPVVVTAGSEHAFVVSSSGISAALVATTETIGPNPSNPTISCPDGGSRTPWGACVSPTSSLQDAQRQAEAALQSATALAAPHAAAEAQRLVLPSGVGRIFVRGIPDGMRAAIVRGGAETALERIPNGSVVANVPSGSATLAVWRETFVVPRMVRSDEHSFPVSIGDGYNTTYDYSPTGLTLVNRELSYGRSAVSGGRVVAGIAVLAGAIALGYYGSRYVD
jgi:hypothetical protein